MDSGFVRCFNHLVVNMEGGRFVEGGEEWKQRVVYHYADCEHRRNIGNNLHFLFQQEERIRRASPAIIFHEADYSVFIVQR